MKRLNFFLRLQIYENIAVIFWQSASYIIKYLDKILKF